LIFQISYSIIARPYHQYHNQGFGSNRILK
jgi:hypothetical protein